MYAQWYVYQLMDEFCDRLELGSTAALDWQTGQKGADIAKQSSYSYTSENRTIKIRRN